MIITSVTKIFEIDYAHYLPNYPGKCSNMHGHRGRIEVEIEESVMLNKWKVLDYEGMIIDFGELKEIVEEKVINKLDHKCINDIIEVPTAEETVRWIWQELIPVFGPSLLRVRFYETPTAYAEMKVRE